MYAAQRQLIVVLYRSSINSENRAISSCRVENENNTTSLSCLARLGGRRRWHGNGAGATLGVLRAHRVLEQPRRHLVRSAVPRGRSDDDDDDEPTID